MDEPIYKAGEEKDSLSLSLLEKRSCLVCVLLEKRKKYGEDKIVEGQTSAPYCRIIILWKRCVVGWEVAMTTANSSSHRMVDNRRGKGEKNRAPGWEST